MVNDFGSDNSIDDPLKICITESIMNEEAEFEKVKDMVRDLKSLPDFNKEPSMDLKRGHKSDE